MKTAFDPNLQDTMLILDTETTGLPHQPWSRVIEVAAIAVRDKRIVGGFASIVHPDCYPAEARDVEKIHGLTAQDVWPAPSVEEVEENLLLFGREALDTYTPTCCSWNGSFDHRMLAKSGFGLTVIDVRGYVRKAAPAKFRRLSDAIGLFGLEPEQHAHTALHDAHVTARLWLQARYQGQVSDPGPLPPSTPRSTRWLA